MTNRSLFLLVVLLALSACDVASSGDFGVVDFTPTDCGVDLGCAFSDDIAIGGELSVRAEGKDDTGVVVSDLQSSNPEVLYVDDYRSFSEWSVVGVRGGSTDLIALNSSGEVVDVLRVFVEEPTELFVDDSGPAFMTGREGNETFWRAQEGDEVELHIRPSRFGREMMGNMLYRATLSADLAAMLDDDGEPRSGHLHFTAAPGDHYATFAFGDLTVVVNIEVVPAPAENRP